MTSTAQRIKILRNLREKEYDTNDHTFIVRNNEHPEGKQYWCPIPGAAVSEFLTDYHELKYVGPVNAVKTREFLAEIDKKQRDILGNWHLMEGSDEHKKFVLDPDYEVDLTIDELRIGEPITQSAIDEPLEKILAQKPRKKQKLTNLNLETDE